MDGDLKEADFVRRLSAQADFDILDPYEGDI